VAENEDFWRQLLVDGNVLFDGVRSVFGALPSDPRCMSCHGPFNGPGSKVMSLIGRGQSREDPRACNACIRGMQKRPGGIHLDLATLFADMRGSTPTAERIGDAAFSELIDRFFLTSSSVLIRHGAMVGRLAGDAAIGYFVPGFAGAGYARAAYDAAVELLEATGHADPGGPWIPLGVGVHHGNAFMGLVGRAGVKAELTALGDEVNVGARLGDVAAVGEVVMSLQLAEAAGVDTSGLEHRTLDLKGKSDPFDVVVTTVG
jgi:adenylate cyclase